MPQEITVVKFDFNDHVLNWLKTFGQVDNAVSIVSTVQEEIEGGYCSTCYTYDVNVVITYIEDDGGENVYRIYDKYMSTWIKELLDANRDL